MRTDVKNVTNPLIKNKVTSIKQINKNLIKNC